MSNIIAIDFINKREIPLRPEWIEARNSDTDILIKIAKDLAELNESK